MSPPEYRRPVAASFADGYTPWPSAPTPHRDAPRGDGVLSTSATLVATDVGPPGEVPVSGFCTLQVGEQRRTVTAELHGTLDCRTHVLRLSGRIADVQAQGAEVPADSPASSEPARSMEGALSPFGLTPREVDVARLLARGEPNAVVAQALGISPHTARRHTENVMLKLGARARAQVGAILRGGEGVGTRARSGTREPGHGEVLLDVMRWREIGDSPDVPTARSR
jgi:DNA-binding CsgD family transcriptional regulator